MKNTVSRRTFVRQLAVAAAAAGVRPDLHAQDNPRSVATGNTYDTIAKLGSNENPYGPSESVMKAMTDAFKYANRYRYPDPGLLQAVAVRHGVGSENVLLGAGSTQILLVAATAFLQNGRKVIGVEPTFGSVYEFATGLKTNAIRLPLGKDYRQDTAALIKAVQENAANIGLVYVCNPNNPTGLAVPKREILQLIAELPRGVPVLVDEAYHDYCDDPDYATSVAHVLEERPVIVARTFSKIFGLAGMRLGYAVAPANLINQMRVHISGVDLNALVKFGGVAALRDPAAQERVRSTTVQLRKTVSAALESFGYSVIPSQGNFLMVHIRRPVTEAIGEFQSRGVLVGRPFPPMLQHLRVSIGSPTEMDRFLAAFKEIFAK